MRTPPGIPIVARTCLVGLADTYISKKAVRTNKKSQKSLKQEKRLPVIPWVTLMGGAEEKKR